MSATYKLLPNYTKDGFRGEHAFLSNMYHSPIEVMYEKKKIIFQSAEQAFQGMKIAHAGLNKNQSLKWLLHLADSTPQQAKKIGKEIKINIDAWRVVAYSRMERIQYLKYSQNDSLRQELVNTGTIQLVEVNYWGDTLWGIDSKTKEGHNYLGEIIMNLRKYYQNL